MMKTDTQAQDHSVVTGSFVEIEGRDYYQISNCDQMPPFLMSIVSPNDHWMYVSSSGGLTAGRIRADNCLFPYQTVDRLHDSYRHTGPKTLVRYRDAAGQLAFWEPFRDGNSRAGCGPRRLLKQIAGNEVVFEETHETLGLIFRYSWRTSAKFGFVRTSTLENNGTGDVDVEVLDGLQNLCPSGVPLSTYQQASCLVDAYKHNEVDPESRMGIYSLTAQISDRAEAAEALQATTVWCEGLPDCIVSLSSAGPEAFIAGKTPKSETLCVGQRGNFYVCDSMRLAPRSSRSWYLVADVGRSHPQVAQVRKQLLTAGPRKDALEDAIAGDHRDLLLNVGSSDGLQATGSRLASTHHFANVLFNNMRGGVPAENYSVESRDFIDFVNARNQKVALASQAFLRSLPEKITHIDLLERAKRHRSVDLLRLAHEYLPLTFGRRHGDPSRPWNAFEVKVHNEDGSKIYNYQGNWRDIFQNWEALCTSFPAYLPSIVAKFLNASTIDGYNPYRITRDGIDWEIPDPDDPWSNIGYWGDHQIVYLTKLLKATSDYFPGELETLLDVEAFCYANVPYRIKPYDQFLIDSRETIDYDQFNAKEIDRRVNNLGADGKLVLDANGNVYYANLIEKLLVPILSKLSNFAVDGGIWLNTQRPEWNDANNALVGAGLSMVTVGYLRRHLNAIVDILKEMGDKRFAVSVEVEQWFRRVRKVLHDHRGLLHDPTISNADRGRILGEMGSAFSDYRLKVYDDGFTGKHTVASAELVEFFRLAVEYFDHSIRANRRTDGLYHSYNLIDFRGSKDSATVSRLYEMLEGQVSVLSSGALDLGQVTELIDVMFHSQLYRRDQRSFMLYPAAKLPGFLDRNHIAADSFRSVELLQRLVDAGDESIVVSDVFGDYHFHHSLQRRVELEAKLDVLGQFDRWETLVANDRQRVLDIFEEVFSHKTYTGRSGTMYSYEGLGSVYWHMVSKLLLAIQENVFAAIEQQASKTLIGALADSYYLVRGGLSSDKTPSEYGAFPTDPYSHSPSHSGAQQPGMTGQVKEEILTRQGELGLRVRKGRLYFQPCLLRRREFLTEASEFAYFDLAANQRTLTLLPGSLAFTFCQVPVIYHLADATFSIDVTFDDGAEISLEQAYLDSEHSLALFQRSGQIIRIDVQVPNERIVFA